MARRILVPLAVLAALLAADSPATGSQTMVWPGVTLSRTVQFTASGPVVVHALTGPRPDGATTLDLLLSNDSALGRETVSSMQRRVAHGAVAGINGDFSRFDNGKLSGLFMRDGELVVAPNPNRSSAGVLSDGTLEVRRASMSGTWRANGGPLHALNRVNEAPQRTQTALFTPAYGLATPPVAGGKAVVLFPFPLTSPNVDLPAAVVEARSADTPVAVPAGGAVLVAGEGSAVTLAAEALPGTTVTTRLDLLPEWPNLVTATGGGPLLVAGGKPVISTDEWFTPVQIVPRAPRSAVGQRADGRIVLVAVDGRQAGYSVGLTNADLARLMVRLGAVTAMALDSGGSTTMAVDGVVVNRPSDGRERPVGSALVFRYDGVFLPLPRPLVSPDGDGVDDTQSLSYRLAHPSAATVTLTRPDGSVAHTEAGPRDPGSYPFVFPPAGTDRLTEGKWRLEAQATDDLGRATAMARTFVVNATLGFVRPERRVLRLPPQGAPLRVLWRLTRQARVTVTVETARGEVMRAFPTRLYEAGERSLTWNGLGRRRVPVVSGTYLVRVRAVNALGVVEQVTPVRVRRVPAV
jgi:hypothetical protein